MSSITSYRELNSMILDFMGGEGLDPKGFNRVSITRKAGIWQGIDSFKDQDMKILRDVNIELPIPDRIDELLNASRCDYAWAEQHFLERISGVPSNPGESFKNWPYANFKDQDDEFMKTEGNKFDHTYMERFWPKRANVTKRQVNFRKHEMKQIDHMGIRFEYGDFLDVIEQLWENPLTRQAYLPIFFPEDTGAKNNMRVPCTLGYLFEIFDNKIDITYYIRSCDVYRHLRNDIYLAGRLLQYVCRILNEKGNEGLEVGNLHMKIANLHLFVNDTYGLVKREKKWKDKE